MHRGSKTKRGAWADLSTVNVAITQRQYVDPSDARITIAELGAVWLEDQAAVLKSSSMHPLESWGARTSSPVGEALECATSATATPRSWVTS